ANAAGLMAPDGTLPRIGRALAVDSTAAMVGAALGTSTTTSYVESAAGVNAGGRTGLVAVTVGVLFLATLFLALDSRLRHRPGAHLRRLSDDGGRARDRL
ncbi:MAG: solute carrier family 23 protein, partial [Hyphomicrobium sp.]